MRRSGVVKFPNSVQLFKFCQKVLVDQKGEKVHDQEVGAILNFNPSDCSHWKRGEKNVKSVFALAKLAEALHLEISLIHDLASGTIGLDEAYFEYQESKSFDKVIEAASQLPAVKVAQIREKVEQFVAKLQSQADFTTPPLYLPEVLRFFNFINSQSADMMDKLSRILRVKPGVYMIQFKKGELKPQTRMSMVKDLSRIVFEAERSKYPELGELDKEVVAFEELLFMVTLLAPKKLLLTEMAKLDSSKNIIAELSTSFWVPKSLVGFQLQDILRTGEQLESKVQVDVAAQSQETTSAL